jgi:hypothetical protein
MDKSPVRFPAKFDLDQSPLQPNVSTFDLAIEITRCIFNTTAQNIDVPKDFISVKPLVNDRTVLRRPGPTPGSIRTDFEADVICCRAETVRKIAAP